MSILPVTFSELQMLVDSSVIRLNKIGGSIMRQILECLSGNLTMATTISRKEFKIDLFRVNHISILNSLPFLP